MNKDSLPIIRQIRNAHKNLCVKTPIDIFYLLWSKACAGKRENHVDKSLHTSKA